METAFPSGAPVRVTARKKCSKGVLHNQIQSSFQNSSFMHEKNNFVVVVSLSSADIKVAWSDDIKIF